MRFPEWLYRLLPGDQGSQQLGVIWRDKAATGVSGTLGTGVYTVPSDKCLVLTNATLRCVANGATTIVTRRRILADPGAGSTRYDIFDNEVNSGAQTITTDNWQGEVVIPGGWSVRVEATFGNPDAGDETAGEIHGYLIPRGTFIFG